MGTTVIYERWSYAEVMNDRNQKKGIYAKLAEKFKRLVIKPEESASKPEESESKPEESASKPEESVSKLKESVSKLEESVSKLEESVSKLGESVSKPIIESIIKSIIKTGFIFLVGCIASTFVDKALPSAFVLPDKVSDLEEKTRTMESDIKEISSKIDTLMGSYETYTGINLSTVSLHPSENFWKMISQLNSGVESTLLSDMSVGTDAITGQEYVMEDLVNQKILVSYVDDGMNVFFYGRYNEEGRWDGKCLLNSYEETPQGNVLRFVREAVYDNGHSVSNKQVFSHKVEGNSKTVWAISDRIVNDGVSSGDTCLYNKNEDKMMDFPVDKCLLKDMITVEQFRETVVLEPYGYYYGNTSDGTYNDETGNSFYVTFFKDGSIKSIYSGNFKKGNFNDNTGNAWYLYKKETDLFYTCRVGNFKNGQFVDTDTEERIQRMDEEAITTFMANKGFDFAPMLEHFKINWDLHEMI